MDSINKKIFFENNFNLIRLVAAVQVAHYHLVSIYGLHTISLHESLVKLWGFFPGVPIFFFISGFLISRSWESSVTWKSYFIKRLARIEPALIVSVIFALSLVFASGYFHREHASLGDIALLFFSKITLFQFYNPEYLRAYGDGVLNGSLWTIVVEIQFYLVLPLIYVILRAKSISNRALIALILVFVGANAIYDFLLYGFQGQVFMKLAKVSFLPWFFMFLVGAFFQTNFKFFHELLCGKFPFVFLLYIALCYMGSFFGVDFGNSFNPIYFVFLACLVFSAAYTCPAISGRLLGGSDISYGIYLYHMPIINYFLYVSFDKSYYVATLIAFTVILVSCLSWYLVEKPALKFAKKYS